MTSTKEGTIATTSPSASLDADRVQELAQAHLDGLASEDELAVLDAHEDEWAEALHELRSRVQAKIDRLAAEVSGPERDLVLADFEEERQRIDEVLIELTGSAPAVESALADEEDDADDEGGDGEAGGDWPDELTLAVVPAVWG